MNATHVFIPQEYSLGVRDGWARLAAAIMALATKQAQQKSRDAENIDAILWLQSDAAELIADTLDLDAEAVKAWAAEIDLCPNGRGN